MVRPVRSDTFWIASPMSSRWPTNAVTVPIDNDTPSAASPPVRSPTASKDFVAGAAISFSASRVFRMSGGISFPMRAPLSIQASSVLRCRCASASVSFVAPPMESIAAVMLCALCSSFEPSRLDESFCIEAVVVWIAVLPSARDCLSASMLALMMIAIEGLDPAISPPIHASRSRPAPRH